MEWCWVWIAIIILSVVLEFISMDMVSIWFTFGGLCGLILNLCGASVYAQVIVAIVVAFLSIIFLRKFALKFFDKSKDKANVEAFVGRTCIVEEPVSKDKKGTAKFNGVLWTAISEDELVANEEAEIVAVKGNKLILKKIK